MSIKSSRKNGIDANKLDELLVASVKRMSLNQSMLKFTQNLREQGVVISLFTNNMDIFDRVSRYHHQLDDYFDFIYSSSAYGQLKFETDAIILKACIDADVGMGDLMLVDDSPVSYETARKLDIPAFPYTDYTASQQPFETWPLHLLDR